MRVVLAERLRFLLAEAGDAPRPDDDAALVDFQRWFSEPEDDDDDAPKVLQHPLSDRKHRHELVRFADALRRPPPRAEEEEEEVVTEEPEEAEAAAAAPRPLAGGNRRLRRKRRKRDGAGVSRRATLVNADRDAGRSAKALAKQLLEDREGLEAELRAFLRAPEGAADDAAATPSAEPCSASMSAGAAATATAEPSAAAAEPFVENPFHAKPGFGGDDALRCICQNPDEVLYPDGHTDDI